MAQDFRGDERVVDGEDEASLARVRERASDAEDRRLIVVRTLVDRRNRCSCSAISLHGDHLFEDLGRDTRNPIEKQLRLRPSHATRLSADEDVAVHRAATLADGLSPFVSPHFSRSD